MHSFTIKYEKVIREILNKKIGLSLITFFIFLSAIALWANFSNQSTSYGTAYGRYDDQADSYSEYLIRNSLVNDFIGYENKNTTLIFTNGYIREPIDFNYYNFNTEIYSHSRSIQRDIYYKLIKIAPDNFINDQPIRFLNSYDLPYLGWLPYSFLKSIFNHLKIKSTRDIYFQFFRFINCILLVFFVTIFFVVYCERKLMSLLLAILYFMVSGIALFSSNLFICFWAMSTPLFCSLFLRKNISAIYYFFFPFFLSYLYFSIHYLFASTFAILFYLPIFFDEKIRTKENTIKFILISLGVSCGFLTEVINHINFVAEKLHINNIQSFNSIFETARIRLLSLTGVSSPFGLSFFKDMIVRLSSDGIKIPLLGSLSKMFFLITLLYIYKKNLCNMRNVCIWSFLAYFSCYLFSYQHIMIHDIYDPLIFSITIQLGVFLFFASFLKRRFYLETDA